MKKVEKSSKVVNRDQYYAKCKKLIHEIIDLAMELSELGYPVFVEYYGHSSWFEVRYQSYSLQIWLEKTSKSTLTENMEATHIKLQECKKYLKVELAFKS